VSARLADPSLFLGSGDPPVLAGSRCAADGTVVFPAQASCPRCSGRDVERVALPDRGVLWSWTVQHFRPRAPFRQDGEEFEPFAVGYVDLGDVVVEARLALDPATAPEVLRIGLPMRLCLLPLWTEADGEILGYAFTPEAGAA
jgi:uncharacterized OB-fold protein